MRLAKHEEEQRRVNIVAFLDGEPKTSKQISDFDGTIATDNMAVFITRLRKKGILISKHIRGHFMAYKLDMPLADALKCVTPKGYAPSTARRMDFYTSAAYKKKISVKASKRAREKSVNEHVPAGENPPWFGILTRREPIDCKLEASCK